MPTEIIESKEIYRGFIALRLATLRLADGARVSREIIEHSKAATVLEGASVSIASTSAAQSCLSSPKVPSKRPALPNMQVQDDPASRWANAPVTGPKSHSLSKNSWR